MPLKPIDLQTLFSQLDQVARERAGGRDGAQAGMQQAIQGSVLLKKREEAAKAVQSPERPEDGPPGVKDRESRRREAREHANQQGRTDETEEPIAAEDSPTVIKDPALGVRVDLTG